MSDVIIAQAIAALARVLIVCFNGLIKAILIAAYWQSSDYINREDLEETIKESQMIVD